MKKHPSLEKIIDWANRHLTGPRAEQLKVRSNFIGEAYLAIRSHDLNLKKEVCKELIRYFPIAAVACIEGYFRVLFRDLIDAGSPYCDNLVKSEEKEIKDLRFKLEEVLVIRVKTVSLGDFISQLLPAGSLEGIDKSMSALLGKKFLKTIVSREPKAFEQIAPIHCDSVKRLFELRHIFAHEIAVEEKPDIKELDGLLFSALYFLTVTESIMEKVLSSHQ